VTTRVLLADDQALVREGFRHIIDAREDLEVVGEAGDGREAIALAESTRPHVILMDVRMPVLDGIEATRRLVASGHPARIVILTTFDLDEAVYGALRAGASGFMLKDIRAGELVQAIRLVARGEALLAPTVTRRLLDRFADAPPASRPRSSTSSRRARSRSCASSRAPSRTPRSPSGSSSPRRPSSRTSRRSCASSACATGCRPSWPPTTPGSSGRTRHDRTYSGRSEAIAPMTFCSHGRSGESLGRRRIRRVANSVMSRRLPTTTSGPVTA